MLMKLSKLLVLSAMWLVGVSANAEVPDGVWTMPEPTGLEFTTFTADGERYYLYNHILEGSMFGSRDKDLKVDIERFVTEFRVGAVVRYDRFFATYYAIFRTDEYKNQKDRPDYGGICIGWTF